MPKQYLDKVGSMTYISLIEQPHNKTAFVRIRLPDASILKHSFSYLRYLGKEQAIEVARLYRNRVVEHYYDVEYIDTDTPHSS